MRTVKLGDVAAPVMTWNPSRQPEVEFEYIDLSAVDNQSKAVTSSSRVTGSEAPSRARQKVAQGDVLVSTVRPNLNAVAVVPPELDGATASTGFTVLRPTKEVNGQFLFHWVRSPQFIGDMVRQATGASYPAVSDRIVKNSTLPAFSIDEQRRIAAILDHADALRAKRRQVLAHLDTLPQAVFTEMFGDLPLNTALESVTTRITDGTHQPPTWSDTGIPFLFVSNITSGQIVLDTKKFISVETWRELTRRAPIEVGDILYSTVGSFGIPAVVREDSRFAFQRHIAHIKPDPAKVSSDFLAAQLASTSLKRQAIRTARGVAQPTVNLGDIRRFAIAIPSLAAQEEFARVTAQTRAKRALVERAIAADDELFASLQSRAFRGEL